MRRLATSLACAAALAVAACGGEDGPTAQEYRAEARQICQEAERASQRVEQPTRPTPSAIADYFRRLLAPAERATQRFEALEPPEELADEQAAVVSTNRTSVREVQQLIARLEQGADSREVLAGAQERIERLTEEANAAARRLGVPECGQ